MGRGGISGRMSLAGKPGRPDAGGPGHRAGHPMTATLDRSMTKKRANAPREAEGCRSHHAVYARGARRHDDCVLAPRVCQALMVPPDVYSLKKELLVRVDCALLTEPRRPRDGGPRCAAPRPGRR